MTAKLILQIEDTWECQQLVCAVLTFHQYEVVATDTGEEGVLLAAQLKPDLILMDIHLPGIDGLEATHQIKSQPCLAHIPIIALTAADELQDTQRALDAGCCAYLGKPFSPARLVALIQQHLESIPAQV